MRNKNFALKLKAKSPDILFMLGLIGFGIAAVKACMDTPKALKVIKEGKDEIDKLRETKAADEKNGTNIIDDRQYKAAIVKTTAKTVGKVAAIYAPAAGIAAASVVGLMKSHNMLKERNFLLAAAYDAVDKTVSPYRERVSEEVGEEKEKDLFYNAHQEEIVDTKTGEKRTEKVISPSEGRPNMHAVYLEPGSKMYRVDEDEEGMLIESFEDYLNRLCKKKGHLFTNEACEALGIPISYSGQFSGWLYDPDKPIEIKVTIYRTRAGELTYPDLVPCYALEFNDVTDITRAVFS